MHLTRANPFEGTSPAFRIYYFGVIAAGATWAWVAFPGAELPAWHVVFWWVAFAFVAELSPILLPGSGAYITVS